jgi:hypothetical protein
VLGLLASLGEREHIEAAIEILVAQGGHGAGDNPAVVAALAALPAAQSAKLLQAIVAAGAVKAPTAVAGLLCEALRRKLAKKPAALLAAAAALFAALPGRPAAAPRDEWGRPSEARIDAACVVEVVGAIDQIDANLAGRTAAHFLAWPQHYGLDTVLLPALKRITAGTAKAGAPRSTAVGRDALHAAVIAHLERRIAEPLAPPSNWARDNMLRCKCKHCADLGLFLSDPNREIWALKAVANDRTHVEAEVNRTHADLTMRTERRGSPHTLVCVKNQASYERRDAQRKQDAADLVDLSR